MKGKLILIGILAVVVMAAAFGAYNVKAAGDEDATAFNISVKHYVKGDEIDLPREAAVLIQVIKDGQTLTYLPMKYQDRVDATLPVGVYDFVFFDQQSGTKLFECGPYSIFSGDDVRVQAHEQGPGRIPTCYVK